MNRNLPSLIILIAMAFLAWTPKAQAQVWPGDVNNNGIVNYFDLLYLGDAFFQAGPPRDFTQMGIDWEEKEITELWGFTFPDGTDYAFADCDGNGIVTTSDLDAINFNFGLTHGDVEPEEFEGGTFGEDPQLTFDFSEFPGPLVEGMPFVVSISLGADNQVVNDFFSIGFTIDYDPNVFSFETFPFTFASSWINPGGNDLLEVIHNDPINGKLTMAATRTLGGFAISGSGPIATLFIIIEDDVVGFSQPSIESTLEFEDVYLGGPGMESRPVVSDTVDVTIENDDFTANDEEPLLGNTVKIFPNPAQDNLHIRSEEGQIIKSASFLSTMGQSIMQNTCDSCTELDFNTQNLADGIYILQVHLRDGILNQKIVISRE